MLKNVLILTLLCLLTGTSIGQVHVPVFSGTGLSLPKDSSQLLSSLDSVFQEKDYRQVTIRLLEIINIDPLQADRYWVSAAVYDSVRLIQIRSFIAEGESGHFRLASPLGWLTRHWKMKIVGTITYHYADSINIDRAREFDRKNEVIAGKLGLPVEKFDFYMTDSYQEILPLLGYLFDADGAGRTRDGAFAAGSIFAIRHNEDFTHDLIHYYVSKIRTNPRNSAAEEGLAYYWGNAYYTDPKGDMIDYPVQLIALRDYLSEHPDSSLLSLFDHNIKPFTGLVPEMSVRSIIAARLIQLIETTRGIEGIKALTNCGKGDDHFINELYILTGINRSNFDRRIKELLSQ